MRTHRFVRLATMLLLAAVSASCSRESAQHEAMEDSLEHRAPERLPPPTATEEPGAPDTALTDAGIEAIVVAANTVDIEAGEQAQKTTKNEAVKAFAAQMVTDHRSINAKATELATRVGVPPKDNATSRKLSADGKEKRASLEAMAGTQFDKAYIDHEVEYHQAVLDLLDQTLIPRSQNADLVALLQSVRPSLLQHLEHARTVQKSLLRDGASVQR